MPQATNVTISKVYEGKSGTSSKDGKTWDWTAYNIYFKESEEKYGYFQSGNKPVPVVGMKIAFLKFDVKQDGQFTNRTITEMVLDDSIPQPTQIPQNAPQSHEEKKAYIDHGECLLKLMAVAEYDSNRLADLIDIFNAGIELMINGKKEEPLENPWERKGEPEEPPDISEQEIPF